MQLLGQVELAGFDKAARTVLEDFKQKAVADAFAELKSRVADQFLTEGAAYGTRWTRRRSGLKPDTNRPLLILTGRLLSSLVNKEHQEHIEKILAGEGSTLTGIFGTRVPYANPLHFGTNQMPARPIFTEAMLSL